MTRIEAKSMSVLHRGGCGPVGPARATVGRILDRFRPVFERSVMSRPTARVLALLELLQSGGTQRVARPRRAARRRRRTVAGTAATASPTWTSRFSRARTPRRLPTARQLPAAALMLADDEALAMLLALAAAAGPGLRVRPARPPEHRDRQKLTRVLPDALRHRLDALLETARFTEPSRSTPTAPASVLLTLAQATDERRPVAIAYASAEGRRSERVLHPYGIVAHAGRWYVTGADSCQR